MLSLLEYLTSTTSLVFLGVFLLLWRMTRRPSTMPPGPPLFPFVGNIPQMGRNPLLAFKDLRKRYGDIFCMYISQRPMVVLNSYKLLREALVKQGEVFSGRPHNPFFEKISEGKGIINVSGKMWREQRLVALNILREFGMGKAILETKINEEISEFLDAIAERANKPQDLKQVIGNAVSNVICNIAFGKRFEYTDTRFVTYLKKVNENIQNLTVAGLVHVFPVLRFLPGDPFKYWKTITNAKYTEDELIRPIIQEHIRNYDENNIDDFIAAYVKEMRKRNEQGEDTTMAEETLVKVVGDLFVAGSETTATALRWILVIFLNYPEIQHRCFKEVEEHIGLNRAPSMKDKLNTPYLEATLMEVLRFCDIAPLAAPHAVTEDVVFDGYKLPKGTAIMINLDCVLNDPEVWGDPQSFRPERFLDETKKMIKPEEYIPFGLGRRACLGEALARMELFLFVTSMVQRFEFISPGGSKPSIEGILGLTHFPASFEVIAKPRT